MSKMATEGQEAVDTDHKKLVAWRNKQLLRVGLSKVEANMIANRTDISLHDALDLLEAGCPSYLMIDILW